MKRTRRPRAATLAVLPPGEAALDDGDRVRLRRTSARRAARSARRPAERGHVSGDGRGPAARVVLAHASVLDRGGYARRVRRGRDVARRFPAARVTVATVESPRALRDPAARAEVQRGLASHGVDLHVVHGWPRRLGLARFADGLAAGRSPGSWRGPTSTSCTRTGRGRPGRRSRPCGTRARRPPWSWTSTATGRRRRAWNAARPTTRRRRRTRRRSPSWRRRRACSTRARRSPGAVPGGGRAPERASCPCLVDDARIPSDAAAEAARAATRRAWGLSATSGSRVRGEPASWQEVPRVAAIAKHARAACRSCAAGADAGARRGGGAVRRAPGSRAARSRRAVAARRRGRVDARRGRRRPSCCDARPWRTASRSRRSSPSTWPRGSTSWRATPAPPSPRRSPPSGGSGRSWRGRPTTRRGPRGSPGPRGRAPRRSGPRVGRTRGARWRSAAVDAYRRVGGAAQSL